MTTHDNITNLRVPPHSIEAEQSVLGSLLLDNGAWDRIEGALAAGDFYARQHRIIFTAVAGLLTAGKVADVITVGEDLKKRGDLEDVGGLVYLNALAQGVPSAANLRAYARIVHDRARHRALIAAADEAVARAWKGGDDLAATLDGITTTFGDLQRLSMRKMPRRLAEIAIERSAHWEALEAGTVAAGWATGIPALDKLLGGGLRPGGLYIVGARPAVGKSSFALNILLHLARSGLPGLFLSMEMPDVEVVDRAAVNVGRVSYSALVAGQMDHDNWSRVTEALEGLAGMPVHVDDQPGLTLRDIRAKAKAVKGLRVMVVDYLQLAASSRRDANRTLEIEEISRGLKALAKELGIAVIALSQLNRDVEKRTDKRPTMADLRDSGAIEQDADVVLFLWLVRELEAEGRRIVGALIGKNRQGRSGTQFGLDFHGDTQAWQQSTADLSPGKPKRNEFAAFE
jgi:replicative DNA helicase